MSVRLRALLPAAAMAAAASLAMAWLGLYGFAWTDYDDEASEPVGALVHGHVAEFLRTAPGYGGSLLERAPFALLPRLWGGGELAIYRSLAAPCLAAVALLGIWLVVQMRERGCSRLARGVALGLCVANPMTIRALEIGHPEELLGAALCVAAVVLAACDRAWAAAIALGLAVANKPWAVVAAGPVLLALPSRRVLCLACAAAVAAGVLAPFALIGGGAFLPGATATATGSEASASIFQPWQVWWFFGHRHGVESLLTVSHSGYRVAPMWADAVCRPLVVAIAVPLTALAWRLRGSAVGRDALRPALLLLSLLLLARCMLDTWDFAYYVIPCLIALTAWEGLSTDRPPVLALSASAVAWVSYVWLPQHVNPDALAVAFLLWTVPLAVALGTMLYGRRLGEEARTGIEPVYTALQAAA